LRRISLFTALIFLVFSLISFSIEGEKRVLRQGKDLRTWLSDKDIDEMYRYLDGAGIDIDRLMRNPYFYEGYKEKIFFLEIEGSFRDLRLKTRGFIEDEFHINGKDYSVKFRPNYDEVALIYNEDRIFISNSLEKAYTGIEDIDKLKKELSLYFEGRGKFSSREIVYRDKKTIYGNSFLAATEKNGSSSNERLYFKSFSIDEKIKKSGGLEGAKVIVDYPELARTMMNSIPEINLDSLRIEGLLDGHLEGAFSLKNGIAIKSKDHLDETFVTELYNEGVLKRIGLTTGKKKGFFFLEFPFFEKRKYVFEDGEWIFISEDLEYLEKLRKAAETDRRNFLYKLNTLLEFREENRGYTGYKEGV